MDLSNVSYFKIHPSIGVARIANNEDYFEFFEAQKVNFSPASDYMSAGGGDDVGPGKQRLKRQAVQFKIFAYDNASQLIGELQENFPGVKVDWTANVGNRKLHNYSSKSGGNVLKAVTAQATASDPGQTAELNGAAPWEGDDSAINLGSISGTGLFIPPKGGVKRENPGSKIDEYPADQGGLMQCTDTTSDGEISATLQDESGAAIDLKVIPSWVVVAPPQHCLTLTPVQAQAMEENFGSFDPGNANQNADWLISTKSLLGIQGDIDDPTGMDVPMMETMNADYNPGMEVNIGRNSRLENGVDPKNFFYPRGVSFIGNKEIRVQPKDERPNATIPGQITSGLCSTWQGDMSACLNYWTAENPNRAYGDNGSVEVVIYQEGNLNATMNDPEEINDDMDFRGIVDYKPEGDDIRLNLVYDPNRP